LLNQIDIQKLKTTHRYNSFERKAQTALGYDEFSMHNRLTGWGEDDGERFSIIYHSNGNIRSKTDVSAYTPNAIAYSPVKPHALTQLNYPTQDYLDFVEGQNQQITYNAFDKTDYIAQGNKRLEFVYGPDQSRKIMKTYQKEGGNFVLKKTKYYILGNTEIEVEHPTSKTRTLNYIGGQAILEQSPIEEKLYYLHKDYQGSLLAVTDESGDVVQRFAYDPWGRRRDPGTWRNLTASEIEQQSFLFARGYTGHEHLDDFGLINMNGRMYDPLLGRMLSPDNYVQAPDNSQNFNRYSYAMNNPLVYTDPDGEFFQALFFAGAFITDFASNLINGVHDPAGNAYNNVTNTINGINSCLQVPIYTDDNTSISAGVNPLAMGISINGTYKSGNVIYSRSVGIGFGGWYVGEGISYTSEDFSIGINAGSGNNNFGIGINATYKGYGGGYYLTQYGNAMGPDGLPNNQLVGGANIFLGDVSLRFENDFLAWQGEDRWRSNALEISINEFSIGTNLYNNYRKRGDPFEKGEYSHAGGRFGKWVDGQTYSSPVYFGYRNGNFESRIGFSHPNIQHFTQNKEAHEKGFLRLNLFGHANYFMNYEHFDKGLYMYSGPYNPFSLWGR
jgi:RHS repeat-associated protein